MLGLARPLPVSESRKGGAFVFPTACPACGTTVVKEEVGRRTGLLLAALQVGCWGPSSLGLEEGGKTRVFA